MVDTHTNKLDDLKQHNINIASQIDRADIEGNFDLSVKLKRQYHTNKISMIDLIASKNEKLTTSARDLRTKVKNMPKAIRYATGIIEFDEHLRDGFEVGSLIQLAGQSFSGKTTLFLQIIANISKYANSVFFNFEMGDRRIVKRLTDLLTEEQQWDNLLINSETRSIEDLIMEITILANDGMKFFAVDSRMKLKKEGSEAEYQKIAFMSSALSECAIKNDIIILMINQISEEDLKSKRLSFKGSGDQLFDSDMALFIVIEEKENKVDDNDVDRRLVCIKNRQDEHLFNFILPNNKVRPCINVTEYVHEETDSITMSVV